MIYYAGAIRLILLIWSSLESIFRQNFSQAFDFTERYGRNSWAFVTGGANGIGLEFCKQLAKKGISVVMVDRDQKALDIAQEMVKAIDPTVGVRTIFTDLLEENTVEYYEGLVKQVVDLDVSILINNACFASQKPFNEESISVMTSYMKIQCVGPTLLSSLFLQRFERRSKRSAIINMSSAAGLVPVKAWTMYSVCKSFLRFFTLGIHTEFKNKYDIISVAPAFITTAMTGGMTGFGVCMPETTVTNVLNDLGKQNETHGFWHHELVCGWYYKNLWHASTDKTR